MKYKFNGLDEKLLHFLASIECLLEIETIENPEEVVELYKELCEIGEELFNQLGHMHECFNHPPTKSYPSLLHAPFLDKEKSNVTIIKIDTGARNQLAFALDIWKPFKKHWVDRKAALEEFGTRWKNSNITL